MAHVARVLLFTILMLALSVAPALAGDGEDPLCPAEGGCAGGAPSGPGTGGSGTEPTPPNVWDNVGQVIQEEYQDIVDPEGAPDLDTSNFDAWWLN